MNKAIYALSFALISCPVLAQTGSLTDAEVRVNTSTSDPAVAATAAAGQWIAFSIPAIGGTRSPCCWKGKWNHQLDIGCGLERLHQSFGTVADAPITENVIVFAHSRDGEINSLRVVGEQCPVDGGGQAVTWIDSVDAKKSLDWLETTARSSQSDNVADFALYAMAVHENREAGERLYSLASESGEDLAQESIFWLGERRGSEGLEFLERLLLELPIGEKRREINFALAQNGTPPAINRLVSISRKDADPEQRSGALFWLAEEAPEVAQTLLLDALDTETNDDVIEEIVFAISQLPSETGAPMLLELAQDKDRPREIRRQALFWLADSSDDETVAALVELLTH